MSRPDAPLMSDLERYCVANLSVPSAAVRAADADGWMEVPDQFMRAAPASLDEAEARMRTSRAGMRMLFAGRGRMPSTGDAVEMNLCLVGTQPGDYPALARDAAAWVGLRPISDAGGQVAYGWLERPGGRRPLDGVPNLRAAAEGGTMRMLLVMRRGDMVLVGYAVPRLRGQAA